jgi:hypothetical protein
MPATCRFFNPTQRRLEERVHTRPEFFRLVRVEPFAFHARGEKGRIQIALRGNATLAEVPTLRDRLTLNRTAAMTNRAQPRGARGEFVDLTASISSFAFQFAHEPPRRPNVDRLAKVALKRTIGDFFQFEDIAQSQNPIDQAPMQTLAIARVTPLEVSLLRLGCALAS